MINILGGEENILCYKNGQDRYPTEDIFLHEFFHGLHNLGIDFSIADFNDRLSKRYNFLKNSGDLWKNTYAMSTRGDFISLRGRRVSSTATPRATRQMESTTTSIPEGN